MDAKIMLRDDERTFLVELLENERKDLRTLLHYSERWSKAHLQERLRKVERLLERIAEVGAHRPAA